ncbi:hypothetical protein H8959_007644 [Pygathrix nigripes]
MAQARSVNRLSIPGALGRRWGAPPWRERARGPSARLRDAAAAEMDRLLAWSNCQVGDS